MENKTIGQSKAMGLLESPPQSAIGRSSFRGLAAQVHRIRVSRCTASIQPSRSSTAAIVYFGSVFTSA